MSVPGRLLRWNGGVELDVEWEGPQVIITYEVISGSEVDLRRDLHPDRYSVFCQLSKDSIMMLGRDSRTYHRYLVLAQ